jgi:hypothetical protein
MAAVDDAVADSGYGALEATDRTVDCRAADGARGRGRHIGSPGYHAHCASNDVHFDPCPRTSPAVCMLAIHQATPVPSPLTCEIVARVRAGCRCNLAACQSSTGGTRFERDRTIDRLHNFPSNHRLMCALYGVQHQPPAESLRLLDVGISLRQEPSHLSGLTRAYGNRASSRSTAPHKGRPQAPTKASRAMVQIGFHGTMDRPQPSMVTGGLTQSRLSQRTETVPRQRGAQPEAE